MDPIGISSGLLTLTGFALQSSRTLYDLINSFQHHGRYVRQLKDELEALGTVLGSLHETIGQDVLDLSALEIPLRHCGKACEEFTKLINKSTSRSGGQKTSFRDWVKISYIGKDIAGFTGLLAGYKSTITIALGDANIRTTKVTIDLLREYKAMITNTTSDLEDILHDFDEKMRDPTFKDNDTSEQGSGSESAVEEERASIQQCLKICLQVSTHIDEVQAQELGNVAVPSGKDSSIEMADKSNLARLITNEALEDCRRGLGFTTLELKARLRDAERRLTAALRREQWTEDGVQNHELLKEELDSVKQCLSICANAEEVARERVNVFEDVSMADDGHQLIVSTMGDLISAKRVTIGSRSTQWLGQMSDITVQQLSRNHSTGNVADGEQTQVIKGTHFENRHGTGRKLV